MVPIEIRETFRSVPDSNRYSIRPPFERIEYHLTGSVSKSPNHETTNSLCSRQFLCYYVAAMTNHILQMLIAEREKLTRAIAALESEPERRGRPPGRGRRRGPGRPPKKR